jgi:hypothetical protein
MLAGGFVAATSPTFNENAGASFDGSIDVVEADFGSCPVRISGMPGAVVPSFGPIVALRAMAGSDVLAIGAATVGAIAGIGVRALLSGGASTTGGRTSFVGAPAGGDLRTEVSRCWSDFSAPPLVESLASLDVARDLADEVFVLPGLVVALG